MPRGVKGNSKRGPQGAPSKSTKRVMRKIAKSVLNRNAELKYLDVLGGPTLSWNGSISPISDISQGDSDVTRDGDKVMPRSLTYRYFADSSTVAGVVRVICFRWGEATTPTAADILSGAALGSIHAPIAPYYHDGRGLFKVMFDFTYTASNAGSTHRVVGKKFKKLAEKQIKFVASGTSGYDKYYLLHVTDAATGPDLEYTTHFTFTDM